MKKGLFILITGFLFSLSSVVFAQSCDSLFPKVKTRAEKRAEREASKKALDQLARFLADSDIAATELQNALSARGQRGRDRVREANQNFTRVTQEFEQWIQKHPETIKTFLWFLQNHAGTVEKAIRKFYSVRDRSKKSEELGYYHLDYELIDRIFIPHFQQIEGTLDRRNFERNPDAWLKTKKPRFRFATRYGEVRAAYQVAKPKKGEVVYDLGSGYGQFLHWGAILFPEVKFRGVEFVPERARESQRIQALLGLRNVDIRIEDVKKADLSDGDIFYLFNPFPKIMGIMGAKLKALGLKKKIRFVVSHDEKKFFETEARKPNPWLMKIPSGNKLVQYYESIPQSAN